MNDAALAAAGNHARWCEAVCRSHGIPTTTEHGHWAALRRPPAPIPDAVALLEGAAPDDVLRPAQDGPGIAVLDSFADLDLAPLGFELRREAQWMLRGPVLPTVTAAEVWSAVETEEELAEWAVVAGAPEAFRGELLDDPAVRILAARGRDGIQAGAVAVRSGPVVGLWGVCTTKAMATYKAWASLPTAVAGQFPWTPLVACVESADLPFVLTAGFAESGVMRLWQRPAAGGS